MVKKALGQTFVVEEVIGGVVFVFLYLIRSKATVQHPNLYISLITLAIRPGTRPKQPTAQKNAMSR